MQETLRHQKAADKPIKKEQPRHIKAFEYYVSLDKRSYRKVAQKFTVSETSVKKWAKAFSWQEQLPERDKKTSTVLAKKTDDTILKTKAEYRVELQQNIKLIRAALAQIAAKIRDKTFKADSAKDLGTLIKAYDLSVRLDEELLGEAMGGQVTNVFLLPCDPKPRKQVESEVVENDSI